MPRIAILDSSNLIYSDDYRSGWEVGFRGIGCEVRIFDISQLHKSMPASSSSHLSRSYGRFANMVAKDIIGWAPDLAFAHHGRAASNQFFLDTLRHRHVPTAVYLCDEPYECGETLGYAPNFDYVFTMDPGTLHAHKLAKRQADRVFYLPPGVDEDHFYRVPYSERTGRVNVFFLGNATLDPRPKYLKPIDQLIPYSKILFWKPVPKGHPDWIWLKDHPEHFQNCWLGVNVHRDPRMGKEHFRKRVLSKRVKDLRIPGLKKLQSPPAQWGTGFWNDYGLPAHHVNPRFFEMSACGTCVISDDTRWELARLFPMAPRAKDPDHFLELVMYYLEHKDEAEAIGATCSDLILKRHTYRHRAAEILHRVGLKVSTMDPLYSSLGEPLDWLTTQDFNERGECQLSGQTGPYERFTPPIGMLRTKMSGRVSASGSLDLEVRL